MDGIDATIVKGKKLLIQQKVGCLVEKNKFEQND